MLNLIKEIYVLVTTFPSVNLSHEIANNDLDNVQQF